MKWLIFFLTFFLPASCLPAAAAALAGNVEIPVFMIDEKNRIFSVNDLVTGEPHKATVRLTALREDLTAEMTRILSGCPPYSKEIYKGHHIFFVSADGRIIPLFDKTMGQLAFIHKVPQEILLIKQNSYVGTSFYFNGTYESSLLCEEDAGYYIACILSHYEIFYAITVELIYPDYAMEPCDVSVALVFIDVHGMPSKIKITGHPRPGFGGDVRKVVHVEHTTFPPEKVYMLPRRNIIPLVDIILRQVKICRLRGEDLNVSAYLWGMMLRDFRSLCDSEAQVHALIALIQNLPGLLDGINLVGTKRTAVAVSASGTGAVAGARSLREALSKDRAAGGAGKPE